VSPVELEMWKALEKREHLARELGDTFSRVHSAESLLSYPHLIAWTLEAYANPDLSNVETTKDVIRELATKGRLYRDLARIKAGRRMRRSRNWDAWGGEMRRPAGTEAEPTGYVPAREPQRSDLSPEEGEVKKEKVAAG
jgi:hypothetical protein